MIVCMNSKMTKAELIEALEAANNERSKSLANLSTRIPITLHDALKHEASSRKVSVQVVVKEALEQYFSAKEQR